MKKQIILPLLLIISGGNVTTASCWNTLKPPSRIYQIISLFNGNDGRVKQVQDIVHLAQRRTVHQIGSLPRNEFFSKYKTYFSNNYDEIVDDEKDNLDNETKELLTKAKVFLMNDSALDVISWMDGTRNPNELNTKIKTGSLNFFKDKHNKTSWFKNQ